MLVRLDQSYGFAALMLVLLVVWVTDIGGYFAGRGIGGPKLWPRRQPEKDLGRRRSAALPRASSLPRGFAAFGLGRTGPLLLLWARCFRSFRSSATCSNPRSKRRFGVKDSSHIIPGHGGLLDRLDGFRRSRRRWRRFSVFAGRRGWRRPRSYGLVKL